MANDTAVWLTAGIFREGNYDMVGNNMPVFFIRDGMKFPDMVHAFKPNPKSNQQVCGMPAGAV